MEPDQEHEPAPAKDPFGRWAVETLVYLVVMYLVLKPDAVEHLEDRAGELVRRTRRRCRSAVVVWRTRREIDELPEVDETPGSDE